MRKIFWVALIIVMFAPIPRPARAEDRAQLWLYQSTNLLVDDNIDELERIWRRAASAGYSHILLADSKFAKLGDLGDLTDHYMSNVRRVKKLAEELQLKIVPAVFPIGYSNSMLWHDPNLAEGLPVKDALFVVHNGEAQLVADPPVALAKIGWKDDVVKVSGPVAMVRDNPGNARMVFNLTLPQFRCYQVAVKIRTENYTGEPEIKPIADDRELQYHTLEVKRTQDWKEYHIIFNTLDHTEVKLYLGVWGGAHGLLQWRDWRIEEAGLVNVLRRPGTPCVVKGYVEGKDYEPIVDPRLGNSPWKGEYEAWHEAPSIKTHLPEGTKLRVSWYHPAIIHREQVSCCPSEPKIMELLADEARRVKSAFGAGGYMMSHDEIRTMNWCEACRARNMDAGKMLAENLEKCTQLLAGGDVYVWSDMFDPFHNARKDYYLVRGDLTGSWNGLDKNVIIMNWNFEKRDDSLKFFADRGNRQIIAGYYDGDVDGIKDWLASAAKVRGVIGVMYTTWQHKYGDLEAFARACGK